MSRHVRKIHDTRNIIYEVVLIVEKIQLLLDKAGTDNISLLEEPFIYINPSYVDKIKDPMWVRNNCRWHSSSDLEVIKYESNRAALHLLNKK